MFFAAVIYLLLCIFLVILVLLQRGDGGLGSIGGASNSILGASAGNILTKTTYIVAILFFVFALSLSVLSSGSASVLDQIQKEMEAPAPSPSTNTAPITKTQGDQESGSEPVKTEGKSSNEGDQSVTGSQQGGSPKNGGTDVAAPSDKK